MVNNIFTVVYEYLSNFGSSPLFYLPIIFLIVSFLFRIVWDLVKGRYS